MSRVGKKPLEIPAGVTVEFNGRTVKVTGPKGNLSQILPPEVNFAVEGKEVVFTPVKDTPRLNPVWGTARALVRNMVEGVTKGYSIKLNLIGVGYRANMAGSKLNMSLGYSHPVVVDIPTGLQIEVSKDMTEVVVTGIDKAQVGQFASVLRSKRPPEPFKGKGVRYTGEHINMKEGKKK